MPALRSGSSSMWRTAATAAARAPSPMRDQPAVERPLDRSLALRRARRRAPVQRRRGRSGLGWPSGPQRLVRAEAQRLAGWLRPGFAALHGAALGDPPVEWKQHPAAGGRALRVAPLAEPALARRAPSGLASPLALRAPQIGLPPLSPSPSILTGATLDQRVSTLDASSALSFSSIAAPTAGAPARRPDPCRRTCA